MTVLGIHATDSRVAQKILASGFRPGSSLSNYLGEGAYFYLVHGNGGYQNAMDCARKVAGRRYRDIALLATRISIDHALNLQNPFIRPLFVSFSASFDRRLAQLGVQVEPNDNESYYRPVSHLAIEAFRRCIEALSGQAFDVLIARFSLKSRHIDDELPHEICVKRSRAVISTSPCVRGDRRPSPSSDPAGWPCSESTVRAAQQAVLAIGAMDDRDILDLVLSIYQGSDGCWDRPRSRFTGLGPVHIVYDSRQRDSGSAWGQSIVDAGRTQHRSLQSVDLARVARMNTSRGQACLGSILDETAGVLALLGPTDTEVASLLTTLAERRPNVPILGMMALGQCNGDPGRFRVPILMRSRHNLCCLNLPGSGRLAEIVRGFLHDRWTDGLAILEIESKMAARHGTEATRHRDSRKIVEALHARKHGLL
jgi:hypothetical protein